MTRRVSWFLLAVSIGVCASSLSAFASGVPASISGVVRNSGGVPQMGAAVEILALSGAPETVYTDEKGQFFAKGIVPGLYTIRVSAPSFLPSIRDRISVAAGNNLVVNITLNTLFEAIQLVPRRSRSAADEDDWRWTLRSVANRPILRLADDGPFVVVRRTDDEHEGELKAKVSFIAGAQGENFSGADMATQFQLEQSLFHSATVGFSGSLGYAPGVPSSFRATYSRPSPMGTKPEFSVTAKRFTSPELLARHAALQALAASTSDTLTFGKALELSYGGEMQTIQFVGRATAFRPFGSAEWHLSDNTKIGYRYTTSVPNMRGAKGFDTAPSDLSESGPRISLLNNRMAVERSSHHEIAVSQRVGKNNFQVAAYRDRVRNLSLTGVGDSMSETDFVPDVYSGTFSYNGGELATSGFRAVYERKLFGTTAATLDYSYGGVLTAPENTVSLADVRGNLKMKKRQSVAMKFNGTISPTRTKVLASYRLSSEDAVTPVDYFNTSPGQADPFLNLFVRQPLPSSKLLPAGMEALVDVRNLLAQGYRPVLSRDGSTLYLVQAPRSVRGGLSFTF